MFIYLILCSSIITCFDMFIHFIFHYISYLLLLLLLIHWFEYYFWLNKSSYRYALWTERINSSTVETAVWHISYTEDLYRNLFLVLSGALHNSYLSTASELLLNLSCITLFTQINNKWAVVAVTWAFLDKSLPTDSSNAISRAWHREHVICGAPQSA